ncbi:MAG: hypothetical protein M1457_05830, partial [bacterium]|nr:hypothetical protein [bacterium]
MAWACFLGAVMFGARAETAVFVSGVSDANGANPSYRSEDGYLRGAAASGESSPREEGNWGALTYFQLGRDQTELARPIIRFDVASLAGKCRAVRRARLILTGRASTAYGAKPELFPRPFDVKLW